MHWTEFTESVPDSSREAEVGDVSTGVSDDRLVGLSGSRVALLQVWNATPLEWIASVCMGMRACTLATQKGGASLTDDPEKIVERLKEGREKDERALRRSSPS